MELSTSYQLEELISSFGMQSIVLLFLFHFGFEIMYANIGGPGQTQRIADLIWVPIPNRNYSIGYIGQETHMHYFHY